MRSRDLQTFKDTDARKFTEELYVYLREMVFKDCKVQEIVSRFLVKILSRLYKIVKSYGPLDTGWVAKVNRLVVTYDDQSRTRLHIRCIER